MPRKTLVIAISLLLSTVSFAQKRETPDTVYQNEMRQRLQRMEAEIRDLKEQLRLQQEKLRLQNEKETAMKLEASERDTLKVVGPTIEEALSQFKFKRFTFELYTKIGTGFVTVDKETHKGLFTANMELFGLQAKWHFKRQTDAQIVLTAPVSVLVSTGWGPTLVAENTVYNYLYFTGGLAVNQFSSTVSYCGTVAVNTSGDRATNMMYGGTILLDGIQTPFFASFLFGDKGFQYLGVAGIKIPLTHLFPFANSRSQ